MTIPAAKLKLYHRFPLFGSILFNLPIERDDKVGTIGVDGNKLYYNEKFWNSLKNNEQLGILCHEVGHLFFGHLWRKGGRDAIAYDPNSGQAVALFNVAGDIVINILIEEQIQLLRSQGYYSNDSEVPIMLPKEHLVSYEFAGKATEEVYDTLKKGHKDKKMESVSVCQKSMWGKEKTNQEKEDLKKKWEQVSKQAIQHARQKGNMPTSIERAFKELEPKEDWREVLLQYVQVFQNDYSFSPTDRRYLEEEFVLPDIAEGQKLDWIAVAVDTSGSISEDELNHFIAEIKAIISSYDKVKVKLTFCDAKATPFVELEEFESEKIKPTGGGGTDFVPVFKLVSKEQDNPLALLYFTDTYGSFPSKAPEYDTIWVSSTGKQKTPFGKVLPYQI